MSLDALAWDQLKQCHLLAHRDFRCWAHCCNAPRDRRDMPSVWWL